MCLYLCIREIRFIKVKKYIRAGEQVAERSRVPKANITHTDSVLKQSMQRQLQIFC